MGVMRVVSMRCRQKGGALPGKCLKQHQLKVIGFLSSPAILDKKTPSGE